LRFLFRLALAFGTPVATLARTLTASELQQWIDFAAVEPFGPLRDDLRAGVLAATFAAGWGGPTRLTPADFFPTLREPNQKRERIKAVPGGPPRGMCVWLGAEIN
jgi:hypothetical protein